MNTNQAIHMIQDHGHKAFATADGLLAIGAAICHADVVPLGDMWFEESTVFEVRDDGTVDSAAIRRWLGY